MKLHALPKAQFNKILMETVFATLDLLAVFVIGVRTNMRGQIVNSISNAKSAKLKMQTEIARVI